MKTMAICECWSQSRLFYILKAMSCLQFVIGHIPSFSIMSFLWFPYSHSLLILQYHPLLPLYRHFFTMLPSDLVLVRPYHCWPPWPNSYSIMLLDFSIFLILSLWDDLCCNCKVCLIDIWNGRKIALYIHNYYTCEPLSFLNSRCGSRVFEHLYW